MTEIIVGRELGVLRIRAPFASPLGFKLAFVKDAEPVDLSTTSLSIRMDDGGEWRATAGTNGIATWLIPASELRLTDARLHLGGLWVEKDGAEALAFSVIVEVQR